MKYFFLLPVVRFMLPTVPQGFSNYSQLVNIYLMRVKNRRQYKKKQNKERKRKLAGRGTEEPISEFWDKTPPLKGLGAVVHAFN